MVEALSLPLATDARFNVWHGEESYNPGVEQGSDRPRCAGRYPLSETADEAEGDLLGRRGIHEPLWEITVGYGHDSPSVSATSPRAMFLAAGTHPLNRSRPHVFVLGSPQIPCLFLRG